MGVESRLSRLNMGSGVDVEVINWDNGKTGNYYLGFGGAQGV